MKTEIFDWEIREMDKSVNNVMYICWMLNWIKLTNTVKNTNGLKNECLLYFILFILHNFILHHLIILHFIYKAPITKLCYIVI